MAVSGGVIKLNSLDPLTETTEALEEEDDAQNALLGAHANWRKMKSDMRKDGFRDGIVDGREVTLQKGFNVGYEEAFQDIFPVAVLRGVVGALCAYLDQETFGSGPVASILEELARLEEEFARSCASRLAAVDSDSLAQGAATSLDTEDSGEAVRSEGHTVAEHGDLERRIELLKGKTLHCLDSLGLQSLREVVEAAPY